MFGHVIAPIWRSSEVGEEGIEILGLGGWEVGVGKLVLLVG